MNGPQMNTQKKLAKKISTTLEITKLQISDGFQSFSRSEKDDYLVSWVWTNNLNDKSEVFFTPKKVLQENDIDLSKSQIGRINCKEGGSAQADQFLFFDRDDN